MSLRAMRALLVNAEPAPGSPGAGVAKSGQVCTSNLTADESCTTESGALEGEVADLEGSRRTAHGGSSADHRSRPQEAQGPARKSPKAMVLFVVATVDAMKLLTLTG